MLKWEKVNIFVSLEDKEFQILSDVSSFANTGEVLANLGSSGSGKTSLLSAHIDQIQNYYEFFENLLGRNPFVKLFISLSKSLLILEIFLTLSILIKKNY